MMMLRWVIPALFSFFATPLFAGPAITSIAPAGGPVGISITITGSNFGATQGASVVSLNAVNAFVARWSDTEIVAVVPSGASSGPFSVTVSGQTAGSSAFTVTALPAAWAQRQGSAAAGHMPTELLLCKARVRKSTAHRMRFTLCTSPCPGMELSWRGWSASRGIPRMDRRAS